MEPGQNPTLPDQGQHQGQPQSPPQTQAQAPTHPPSASPSHGGGTPEVAKPLGPHPDFGAGPAKPGDARVNPIWVAPDDWTKTQSELQGLREFKRQQDHALEMKDAERIKALAEKGQVEEALTQLRTGYEKKLAEYAASSHQIESEWLGERRTAEIQKALQGRTFTGVDPKETADMVRTLLEGEIEAVRVEGKPVIRDRATLRPAAEYLKERLESPRYSVFFTATNRGGAGTDGARPAAATPHTPGDPFSEHAKAFRERLDGYTQARFLTPAKPQ